MLELPLGAPKAVELPPPNEDDPELPNGEGATGLEGPPKAEDGAALNEPPNGEGPIALDGVPNGDGAGAFDVPPNGNGAAVFDPLPNGDVRAVFIVLLPKPPALVPPNDGGVAPKGVPAGAAPTDPNGAADAGPLPNGDLLEVPKLVPPNPDDVGNDDPPDSVAPNGILVLWTEDSTGIPFLPESKPAFDELLNGFEGGPPNGEAPEVADDDPNGFDTTFCVGPDLVDAPNGFVGADEDVFPKGLEEDFPKELAPVVVGALVALPPCPGAVPFAP